MCTLLIPGFILLSVAIKYLTLLRCAASARSAVIVPSCMTAWTFPRLLMVVATSGVGTFPSRFPCSSSSAAPRVPMRSSSSFL